MCDEGRLSYKALQENRQEQIFLRQKVISEEDALNEIKRLIEIYKGRTVITVDANLYTEDMKAILSFANNIGATVHSPLEDYIDPTFGDELLKSDNRAANSKSIEKLKIDTSMPLNIGLLINFNHPLHCEAESTVCFSTHKTEMSPFVLPLATYLESEGHVTNEDGIVQKCEKALALNNPVPSVLQWIEKVMS